MAHLQGIGSYGEMVN